jgi:hypothetical protein
MLNFIARYGLAGAILVAILVAAAVIFLGWPAWGGIAILAACVIGAIVFVIAQGFVELVRLVSDTLMPR